MDRQRAIDRLLVEVVKVGQSQPVLLLIER